MKYLKLLFFVVLFIFLFNLVSATDWTTNNIMWYQFTNTSNSTTSLKDWSPYKLNLTNNGSATLTTNGGYKFDGSINYMTAPHNAIQSPSSFTLNTWVQIKLEKSPSPTYRIVTKVSQLAGYARYTTYWDYTGIRADIRNTVPTSASNSIIMSKMKNRTWQLLTITYDSSTNSFKEYLDGNSWSNNTLSSPLQSVVNIRLQIGRFMGFGQYYKGNLSSINMFNDVKTQSQIIELYNLGRTYNPYNVPSTSNFSISAKSSYNNSAINSFSITAINGSTTKNYNSSGGSVAKWSSTDKRKYNITCKNVLNYHDKTYLNYNFSASGNLECLMNKKGAYINFFTKDNSMTEKARITSSGFLGVGTTNPQYMIHINSTTDGNILALQDTDGLCLHNPESASETVTCSSDKVLKKDIRDTNIKGIETISKYKIKDFTLVASGQVRTGVIAQELQQTMPDKVKNIDGILMVELPNLWTLAKAIQELSATQINLKYELSNLQNMNQNLITQLTDANDKILTMQTDIATMKTQICTINKNCPIVKTQSLMTTNTTNNTQ